MGSNSEIRQQLESTIRDALAGDDPRRNPALSVRQFGACQDDSIRYFLYADVVAELFKAARYRREEATAILMGRFRLDDNGPFIEVTAFRRLEYLYGEDPVATTLENIQDLLESIDDSDGNDSLQIVGGFMAKPDSGARFDEESARLHLSLFNLPHQPLLVVDGQGDRLGVYARGRRTGFDNHGFYVVERSDATGQPTLMGEPPQPLRPGESDGPAGENDDGPSPPVQASGASTTEARQRQSS